MNMNEGLTEIRPATADEQIRAWLDRHIELHEALAEELYIEDIVAEECNARYKEIHILDVAAVRRMAKACNAAWAVRRLAVEGLTHTHEIRFSYKGWKIFDVCTPDELTPEELKWLEEQEA